MNSVACKHCDTILFQYEKKETNQNFIIHCRKCEIMLEVSFDELGTCTTKDVELDVENINTTYPWPDETPS